MVRGPHRALVVLDHEHRVAEVPQALERRDQPAVVALVQPDRRLVEDVQHADQRGADLRGQPDPLSLAARQRRRRSVHRQVPDADVVEEPQALGDLAQDQPRDPLVVLGELELVDPFERTPRRQRGELVNRRVRRSAPPATRAAAVPPCSPGTGAASCTPRSSRARARTRSRGNAARGSGRIPSNVAPYDRRRPNRLR